MWIGEVDFPEALIDAHRVGKLVIFVGAGASRDSPSGLPDFRTLTAEIARDAEEEVSKSDLEQPDVLLGRLADRQVDVHLRVATRIGTKSSKPNPLHEAIVDLAASGSPLRIVTTNYDLHLSTLLERRGIQVDEYLGPALPMGDDFTGVIYLHGNLRREPRQLVVTDGDFGRAYLRDAWAARFLERMFATFTVLFVGYSHADAVMRYLARALGPDRTRYALTSTPKAPDWQRLGLRTVGYPEVDQSHAALGAAIGGWASRASMGLLAHRQRVAELAKAPPSQVPEEASYLEALLAEDEKARLFAELARGEEWLSWAATRPQFRCLFDPSSASTETTRTLAWWFAEHYVMDESLSAAALRVVRDAGGRLAPVVWWAIGQQLHARGAPRPEWLQPWLVLLIQSDPEIAHPWLDYAIVASLWPEDRSVALLLLDHLTEPRAAFRPSFALSEAAGFDVHLRGSGHWLREAWQKVFLPNLAEAGPAVLVIVDRQLRRAHQLLSVTGSARPGWDPISFRRSRLDQDAEDRIGTHTPVDVLIDAARDCIEALLEVEDDHGVAFLKAWAGSDVPMLRRLAVHGWAHRADVDGTSKIDWLRERGWLFDPHTRHEVFRLIEVALPSASDDAANALVDEVLAGPRGVPEANRRAFQVYSALAWITRHAPALGRAREGLDQLQADHPGFAARQDADRPPSDAADFVGGRPPMTATELHERITTDAAAAISELRVYEHVGFPSDGPSWEDALWVLVEAVRDHPADGFLVLDAGHHDSGIAGAVVGGWSAALVEPETAEAILSRLAHADLGSVAPDIALLLSEGGRGETNPTEWHRFPASRRLAVSLWEALAGETSTSDDAAGFERAMSDPAGQIAQFWVQAVAADWRAAGESWAGLPDETRIQLEMVLGGDDHRTLVAEVVFASRVLLFFGADRAWCEAHILSLLDWTNPVRARRTWDGYLSWGRFNDQLLRSGLLQQYLATATHADDLGQEPRRQLWSHLAAVAVFSEIDALPWMRTLTRRVGVAGRVDWMNQVSSMLGQLEADAVEHQWHRWMQRYWHDRLESIPISLTFEEASAMAGWIVHLTESIESGVTFATAHRAAVAEHGDFLHDLDDRLDRAPTAFAKLLAHLLRHTALPFYGGHFLAKIVPRLRHAADPDDLKAVIEEAMRLGWANAAEW